LAAAGQQAGNTVGHFHAQNEIVKRVVGARDVGKRQRKELKIFLAACTNGGIVSAVENAQVAFGINEYDCFRAALNRLHQVKLEVMSLAGARRTLYLHVTFEIAERQENRSFLTTANSVNSRHTTGIAGLTLPSD